MVSITLFLLIGFNKYSETPKLKASLYNQRIHKQLKSQIRYPYNSPYFLIASMPSIPQA